MSDNVVELPRREAWIATLQWILPEALHLAGGVVAGRALIAGLVRSDQIIDCDLDRDVRYEDESRQLVARFEITEGLAREIQTDAARIESVMGAVMPGAMLSVERGVWERSHASTPPIDHENWHPRCVALLSVLADSEHPEADAERYAVLEMLRNAVRRVV